MPGVDAQHTEHLDLLRREQRVAVGDDEVGGAEHALAEGLGVERANGRVGAAGHEGDVAVDLAVRIALDQLAAALSCISH
jgi:hypothetical protein